MKLIDLTPELKEKIFSERKDFSIFVNKSTLQFGGNPYLNQTKFFQISDLPLQVIEEMEKSFLGLDPTETNYWNSFFCRCYREGTHIFYKKVTDDEYEVKIIFN